MVNSGEPAGVCAPPHFNAQLKSTTFGSNTVICDTSQHRHQSATEPEISFEIQSVL